MLIRNGIEYGSMIRGGVEYGSVIRNGVEYGGEQPSPESFRPVYSDDPENTSNWGYYEYLPEGYEQVSEMPLIIFLSGSGEKGDGTAGQLPRVLNWGIPKLQNAGTYHEPFITLSPQWLDNGETAWYDEALLADFIAYVKGKYKVDSDRVYLVGLSAGGWYTTYYLENLPTSHGIAAAVVLSTPLETGYTTPAGVAASNCPMWFLSNIGDPTVAWDDSYPLPYGYSVVGSRDAINAVNPIVERLTGFDNPTHDGSWDGICSGALIGQADPGYDPFDEPIYNWLLRHDSVYDSATREILDYANAQGYSLPSNVDAIDQYIRKLRVQGLWVKIDILYLFANDGDNNFRLINYKNPGAAQGTIFGGVIRTDYGFEGNGIDGYVNTNFIPATHAVNYQLLNASVGFVSYKAPANAQVASFESQIRVLIRNDASSPAWRINTTQNVSSPAIDGSNTGMVVATLNGSGANNFTVTSKDVVSLRTSNVSSASMPNVPLILFAVNNNWFAGGQSVMFAGAGLTFGEIQNLRTITNEYLLDIGLNQIA